VRQQEIIQGTVMRQKSQLALLINFFHDRQGLQREVISFTWPKEISIKLDRLV